MNKKNRDENKQRRLYWIGLLLIEIIVGATLCFFVIVPMLKNGNTGSYTAEKREDTEPSNIITVETVKNMLDQYKKKETTGYINEEGKEQISEVKIEAEEEAEAEAKALAEEEAEAKRQAKELAEAEELGKKLVEAEAKIDEEQSDSAENTDNKDNSADYKILEISPKKFTITENCNIRTGPNVGYNKITTVFAQSDILVTGRVANSDTTSTWYRVELEDGTEGYINGLYIKATGLSDETSPQILSDDPAKSDNNITEENISSDDEERQEVTISDSAVKTPVVTENPGKKYDNRPGDYVGEIVQYLGKPVSEAQKAMPSFTNTWYGETGRVYDNHWRTVEFFYKDVVTRVSIMDADPRYSLMGISCEMPAEEARLILADQGYPFDTFLSGRLYWMQSADGRYEVTIGIDSDYNVDSMSIRLL